MSAPEVRPRPLPRFPNAVVIRPASVSQFSFPYAVASLVAGVSLSHFLFSGVIGSERPLALAIVVAIVPGLWFHIKHRREPQAALFLLWWTAIFLGRCSFSGAVPIAALFPIETVVVWYANRARIASKAFAELGLPMDLRGAELKDLHLFDTSLEQRQLERATFTDCSFVKCSFGSVDGRAVTFLRCRFFACDFGYSSLPESAWVQCEIERCRFGVADLSRSAFTYGKVTRTHFDRVNLKGADLRTTFIPLKDIQGCDMDDSTQLG